MKPPPPLPMRRAKAIAEAIKADPVSAAQVKEHLPDKELAALLEIRPSLASYADEDVAFYLRSQGYSVV